MKYTRNFFDYEQNSKYFGLLFHMLGRNIRRLANQRIDSNIKPNGNNKRSSGGQL